MTATKSSANSNLNASQSVAESAADDRKRLPKIFTLLMVMNMASLIVGLVTNIFMAKIFGASAAKDAIETALSIPRNTVTTFGLASLGGSSLYVVGRLSGSNHNRIRAFVSSVFVAQFLYSFLFFVIIVVFRERIIDYMSPGMSVEAKALIDRSLLWTQWLVISMPLVTLFASVATGLQRFGTIPLGAILEKIGTLGGVLLVLVVGVIAYPAGTVVGNVAGLVILSTIVARMGIGLSSDISFFSPEMKEAFRLSLPWVITAPVLNISNWILVPLMNSQGPGSLASFTYANILNTMLVSLLLTPLNDGLAPFLAKNASRSAEFGTTDDKLREESIIRFGFRSSLILGVFLSLLVVACARPIVGVIYFHGAMTLEAARQISNLTAILALGLLGRGITLFGARLFQAKISIWSYIAIQIFDPLIKIPAAIFLVKRFGISAIAIATTLSIIVCGGASLLLGARQIGHAPFRVESNLLIWIGTLTIMGAAVSFFPIPIYRSSFANVGLLAISGLSLIVVAFGLARVLGIKDFERLLQILLEIMSERLNRIRYFGKR